MAVGTSTADGGIPAYAAQMKYSTGIARVIHSPAYRYTLGAVAEWRYGRILLLAGVPVVWMLMMHIGPIYEMLRISLLSSYPPQPGVEANFTLDNYALFFSEKLYWMPLLRSFVYASIATAVTLIVVYPVAYYVAKVVSPGGRSRALLLLLAPFWAGEIIRIFSVIMLLANRGAVNVLLREIGLTDRPIQMLYTSFSISFGLVYMVCLYMLLPLYSAIEKIPKSLLDASADLGAGPFTRFRRIVLPLSRDGIVSGCSLVFLTCMGVFSAPILLGGPTTSMFSETISSFFHGASSRWPAGAAFAMIMLAASLVTVGLFMRVVGGSKQRTF
ncbi:ABC transporter permease [Ensifer sp. ENS10]|uniref:ABC transporter permease n=1 Tax=Ensifer sp. ENS10 TaxID=2769286 RepID=UPI001FEDDD36|nr:ABC transporter permease [Ensifer sp. ENS10]